MKRGVVIDGKLIRISVKPYEEEELKDFLSNDLVPRKRITKEWVNEIPPGIH